MKPKNREVNIFNLSMLDVISGALGAILMVMIVLFPFYGRETSAGDAEYWRQRAEKAEKKVKNLEIRNPVVVAVSWTTTQQDVDLFVDDGSKKAPRYDPTQKYGSYWNGDIRTERKVGPGDEMWLLRDMPPGEYKLYLNLFARNGNTATCVAYPYLLYGNKFYTLPAVTLNQEKTTFRLGSLLMDGNHDLTFKGATPEIQRQFEELTKQK